mmetsp:Transcript_67201/g.160999  ORF Transcript_67201/g.160999 Transcript_67201/m.160999 type:complete len:447 (-) Transcript_67201:119-1459(-)|eukprot:CAMPEP_0178426864 /NCGR_PEP_ID=MMETSP0689_2-20121128/29450_1 /TAXON_ID=160604 /ORGANISM="Amphidinium massartii, Strain CS-259" /LENGTH=446 /DNA_ID=CAMNT_0020048555 /DNA_START=71 /DNA_END=1411 /DNA_ORIENTATION=-
MHKVTAKTAASVCHLYRASTCCVGAQQLVRARTVSTRTFDVSATVPAGKFKGLSYEDVMRDHTYYCKWLVGQGHMDGGPLKDFADYLRHSQGGPLPSGSPGQSFSSPYGGRTPSYHPGGASKGLSEGLMGSEVLRFGKHKGKTFQEVAAEDSSYCSFVLRSKEESGNQNLLRFAQYLEAHQGQPQSQLPGGSGGGRSTAFQPSASSSAFQVSSAVPSGSEVLKFGKHRGKTFEEIYEEDQQYADWAVRNANQGSNGNLTVFASFVKARRQEGSDSNQSAGTVSHTVLNDTVHFGKHRGKTFAEVCEEDPLYCEWVLKSQSTTENPHLQNFARYIQALARDGPVEHMQSTPVEMEPPPTAGAQLAMQQQDSTIDDLPMSTLSGEHRVVEGLHKGRSFSDVFDKEQDWCRWLVFHFLEHGQPGSPQWHFVAYVINRWRLGEQVPPPVE